MIRKPLHAKLLMLLISIIWGSGYVVAESALRTGINPIWILSFRFLSGALFVGVLFLRKIKMPAFQTVRHGAVAGVILFFALYLEMIGQSRTAVSNAALITSTNVIIVPYLVWLISKKRPSRKTYVYSLIAMIGVCLLSIINGTQLRLYIGDALVLLGAVLFAFQIAWIGLICVNDCPEQVAFFQLVTAGLCSIVALLVYGEPIPVLQVKHSLIQMLYLGFFPTGLCYYLQSYTEKYAKATDAAIIFSSEGLFGTIISLAVGFETFRWTLIPGGVLIIFSIIMVCKDKTMDKDSS